MINPRIVWPLVSLVVLALTAESDAAMKLRQFHEKIGGAPVEVFVVSDDGDGAPMEWLSAPLEVPYPAPGQSLPELAMTHQLTTAVNANFYREDRPGSQEPIGLVLRAGQVLSLPNSYYPTVGVIDGRLEWDTVKMQGQVTVVAGGKTYREKLCRFNAKASKGCAALWLVKVPVRSEGLVHLRKSGVGPSIGRKTLSVQSSAEGGWTLQWAGKAWKAQPTEVSIEIKLRGDRLGDKWDSALEAVSGSHMLSGKKTFPSLARSWAIARQPRTLTGVDGEGRPFVVVFDGRSNRSRGVSISAAWQFLKSRLNARWAVNLDGGGSTTLLHDGALVNKPSDGGPRALAVGWGARLRPITTAASAPAPVSTPTPVPTAAEPAVY